MCVILNDRERVRVLKIDLTVFVDKFNVSLVLVHLSAHNS